ncbi:MAG: ureidoglycolate lyase [Planctomycetota bacterium]|jgi:ureidoglycolate lyase
MRKEKVKELTPESFAKYGVYANLINPQTEKLGAEPIEFFRDMAQLDLGGRTLASFSTCRVCKRPPVVDVTEFHNYTGEGILPLDADICIHVAPAAPMGEVPLKKIEIFRVPKGTFVALHPGVWHHAPFAHNADAANVLIVLPERTYAQDCHVTEIEEKDRTEFG